MASRTASCSCGQLRIQVEGEPSGVGLCHCLACQQRTGSVFSALASFAAPFKVIGTATEYTRTGDQGAKFIFSFCPICGTTVFHIEDGETESVGVAVGAFADPNFAAPGVSIYESRRHAWVQLPPGTRTFDRDPI
ncbi:MAG: GFA family protein [Deltaproteobacteria bacterium]